MQYNIRASIFEQKFRTMIRIRPNLFNKFFYYCTSLVLTVISISKIDSPSIITFMGTNESSASVLRRLTLPVCNNKPWHTYLLSNPRNNALYQQRRLSTFSQRSYLVSWLRWSPWSLFDKLLYYVVYNNRSEGSRDWQYSFTKDVSLTIEEWYFLHQNCNDFWNLFMKQSIRVKRKKKVEKSAMNLQLGWGKV